MNECLLDINTAQLEALLASLGVPAYRAKQIQHWVYSGLVASFDEMANLPKELRRRLSDEVALRAVSPKHEAVSSDGKNNESALMRYAPACRTWAFWFQLNPVNY